ncbi:hypothetical protein B0H17DRAFT_1140451 [Mycena rosella]|uniref:Uncharacterized protein n=1 Tax=Mycena rosella TaxID=1033263 RepID=A0AAD7D1W3_MYCRO|nr:hypothetical protein B0H17DRAFT_1140451 [Mycena rosella]
MVDVVKEWHWHDNAVPQPRIRTCRDSGGCAELIALLIRISEFERVEIHLACSCLLRTGCYYAIADLDSDSESSSEHSWTAPAKERKTFVLLLGILCSFTKIFDSTGLKAGGGFGLVSNFCLLSLTREGYDGDSILGSPGLVVEDSQIRGCRMIRDDIPLEDPALSVHQARASGEAASELAGGLLSLLVIFLRGGLTPGASSEVEFNGSPSAATSILASSAMLESGSVLASTGSACFPDLSRLQADQHISYAQVANAPVSQWFENSKLKEWFPYHSAARLPHLVGTAGSVFQTRKLKKIVEGGGRADRRTKRVGGVSLALGVGGFSGSDNPEQRMVGGWGLARRGSGMCIIIMAGCQGFDVSIEEVAGCKAFEAKDLPSEEQRGAGRSDVHASLADVTNIHLSWVWWMNRGCEQ